MTKTLQALIDAARIPGWHGGMHGGVNTMSAFQEVTVRATPNSSALSGAASSLKFPVSRMSGVRYVSIWIRTCPEWNTFTRAQPAAGRPRGLAVFFLLAPVDSSILGT